MEHLTAPHSVDFERNVAPARLDRPAEVRSTIRYVVALILLAAVLYSSVGHAGASGYLASMALVGIAPESMKVTALVLNVLVAMLGSVRYIRAEHFDWRTFYPFVVLSVPAAFIGGVSHLPPNVYKPAIRVILLVAAVQLARSAHIVTQPKASRPITVSRSCRQSPPAALSG